MTTRKNRRPTLVASDVAPLLGPRVMGVVLQPASAGRKTVNSAESAQLRVANKRIKALEKELQLVTAASGLFDAQAALPPKDVRSLPKN